MQEQSIAYTFNHKNYQGHFAYPAKNTSPLPCVLVAPSWEGCGELAKQKARDVAALGYAAFAIDLYGDGYVGKSPEENAKLMQPLMEDRATLRALMQTALDTAKTIAGVDPTRMAAMGFCFGGLCVLDLARSGADLLGVVSVHGLLIPSTLPNANIHARVLVLHGYDDPMVPMAQVTLFADEMTKAQVDWQVHLYGHTQHAFTNPNAHDTHLGTVYQPLAHHRSWLATQNFLSELFESSR
jgi:dienelactone hydrolase